MTGELSFFEIGTGDVARVQAFYSGLFGWEFAVTEGGASITTPNVPGGVHPQDAGASPYLFFAVDDLEAAIARVQDLGGSADPMGESDDQAAQFGRFALCADDQGSPFGLHERPSAA